MPVIFSLSQENLQHEANNAFSCAIRSLVHYGELEPEVAERILNHYCLIMVEKGTFGRLIDKYLHGEDDRLYYRLVQHTPFGEGEAVEDIDDIIGRNNL